MTDAEGENILRALAGEPPSPPRIVRNTWADRRLFNTWGAPFPYLLHPWQIVCEQGFVTSGRKRSVSKWYQQWDREEWDDWLNSGRPAAHYAAVPWLVHADCNKAHKCPVCKSYAGINEQLDATDGRVRYWHVYICEMCSQRFARRFYLHEHPCDGHRWEYWDHFKLFWRTAWSQKYYHGPRWWTHGLSIRIEHAVWDWQDRRKERKRKDDQKRA